MINQFIKSGCNFKAADVDCSNLYVHAYVNAKLEENGTDLHVQMLINKIVSEVFNYPLKNPYRFTPVNNKLPVLKLIKEL